MASGKERSRKIHSTVQFMLGREADCWWSRHRKRCNRGWWNSTEIFSEGVEGLPVSHLPFILAPCLGGSNEPVWFPKVPNLWKTVTRGCFQGVLCWLRVAAPGTGDKSAPQVGEFQMTSPARRTLVPCCQTPHPSPLAQLWASLGTAVCESLQCYNAEQGEFQQDEGCQVPPVLTVRSEKEPPPHAKTKNTTDTKIQAFRRNAHEL